jgi:hypothetical protein
MFGLLRYAGKANGKDPKRRKERTLEHAELKTKSLETPVKFLGNPSDYPFCHVEQSETSLASCLRRATENQRFFASLRMTKKVRT